jgi:hypothetical protein
LSKLSYPGRAFRHSGGGPGHRALFLGTQIEEAQERPLPVSGGAGAAPPPKTTAPASWRLTLPCLGITWGGLVGGRGHRKGQLRVLGSPSALRTKEPRTGGPPGGRGVRGPDFFCGSPLVPPGAGWWVAGATGRANCAC